VTAPREHRPGLVSYASELALRARDTTHRMRLLERDVSAVYHEVEVLEWRVRRVEQERDGWRARCEELELRCHELELELRAETARAEELRAELDAERRLGDR
jgi:chromosome segregation ATPase